MTYHSPADIVRHLKGRWAGHHGMCKCPAHEDGSPSLSVTQTRDGRPLVFCHGGCTQQAVIAALKALGLWGDGELTMDPSYPGYFTMRHDGARHVDERKQQQHAFTIWDKALEGKGTATEEYLRARGIKLPLSEQLRFAPHLYHTPSRQFFRAMIARIADDRGFCAVQRTYLDSSRPMKADISPKKMTLGPMGTGAVRLRMPLTGTLGIAEGIETALSASQLYAFPVWATLSANRLGSIAIPSNVRQIIIFGDAGEVGNRQAFAAVETYERQGFDVECIFPAADFKPDTGDFNDALRS